MNTVVDLSEKETPKKSGFVVPSFADAEAKKGVPKALREEIRAACREAALWDSMVKYLTPPGVCGSRQFDHANAIRELLEWDTRRNKGRINSYGVPAFLLWKHLYAILKQVYEARGGVILGQLEFDIKDENKTVE